jgi:hypothetical protein
MMQKTDLGLNVNVTHQVLANVVDINVIGNGNRAQKINGYFVNACKEFGLAENIGKAENM